MNSALGSLTERRARRFWVVWQDPESRAFYYVRDRLERGADVRAFVEQANGPETPWSIRLMCRLEVWPSTAQSG